MTPEEKKGLIRILLFVGIVSFSTLLVFGGSIALQRHRDDRIILEPDPTKTVYLHCEVIER